MTRRASPALALAAAMTVLSVAPPRARSYALLPYNWAGYSAVPVWTDPALSSTMFHTDGTQWTQGELDAEIKFQLQIIGEGSESNLPYVYYAGTRSPCIGWGCRIGGAIVLTSNLETDPAYCKSATGDIYQPVSNGRVIFLTTTATAACIPAPRWEHVSSGDGYVAPAVLLHELGHALGLDHSFLPLCLSSPCTIMAIAGDRDAVSYYYDDVLGYRAAYGAVSLGVRVHEESANAVSWITAPAPPATGTEFALSSATGTRMFAAYHDAADLRVRARTWDWWPLTWIDRTAPAASPGTPGAVGAAIDASSGVAFEALLGGESQTAVSKHQRVVRHTADFASYTTHAWAGETTRRHGVSAAYDPRTGGVVLVWQSSARELKVQVMEAGGTFVSPWPVTDGSGAAVKTYGPASVACGDASIVDNCIIAWSNPAEPGAADDYHTLRWMHFHLTYSAPFHLWTYTQGPIMASGVINHGPPFVAYKGPPASDSAFVFAGVTEGVVDGVARSYVWTMRKTSESTSYAGLLVLHGTTTARRFFPALGSANGTAELIYARRP